MLCAHVLTHFMNREKTIMWQCLYPSKGLTFILSAFRSISSNVTWGLFLLFVLQQCSRWQPDQHLHHHRARSSSERGHLGKKNHWICCHCVITRSLRLLVSLPVQQLSNCRESPKFFVFSSSNQILLLPFYNANGSRGCLLLRSVIAKARP